MKEINNLTEAEEWFLENKGLVLCTTGTPSVICTSFEEAKEFFDEERDKQEVSQIPHTNKELIEKKESPLIKMRAECIKFIQGNFKQGWKEHMSMDIVDCLLVNWFLPYKEKALSKSNNTLKKQQKELKLFGATKVEIEELKKKKEINFGSWEITIRDNMVVCGNCGTQLNIFKFSSSIELPYLYCDDDCLKEHLKEKHKGDD